MCVCTRACASETCADAACVARSCRYAKGQGRTSTQEGNQIRVKIANVQTDVPVVVVFRAMGFVTDRSVLDHVVYDISIDDEMLELFRCVGPRSWPARVWGGTRCCVGRLVTRTTLPPLPARSLTVPPPLHSPGRPWRRRS